MKVRMWFQHNGESAHFSPLNTAYPGRWIERGGPVNWPARSPDLSCLDFFLWGHMKSLVYTSPVDSDEVLVARIDVIAEDIREMPWEVGWSGDMVAARSPAESRFKVWICSICLCPSVSVCLQIGVDPVLFYAALLENPRADYLPCPLNCL
ncbi:uncharacterized protein TNCV_2107621 [Trichonephila clavipes]|nr:uncharacterized protein TNCV_2107621 [Trichonephila clavipes]